MGKAKKIARTADLIESMRMHTGNSTEVAERAERRRLLRQELDRYQEEFGVFTDEEMAEARELLHGMIM